MTDKIDFLSGKVACNELNFLKEDVPLKSQMDYLDEDLLQVAYGAHYVVDVGWYPSFDSQGCFVICVIKDSDWTTLIFQKETQEIQVLNTYLKEAIALADSLARANDA